MLLKAGEEKPTFRIPFLNPHVIIPPSHCKV